MRDDLPLRDGALAELEGWYQLDGPWTDLRKRVFLGAGAEVFGRDGRPWLRFLTPIPYLYRGFEMRPDDPGDPDVYRLDLDEAGTSRVAFERDAGGVVSAMALEMMPLRLERQPPHTNPRRWTTGLILSFVAVVVGLCLGWIVRRR